jgi:hypothetical protein
MSPIAPAPGRLSGAGSGVGLLAASVTDLDIWAAGIIDRFLDLIAQIEALRDGPGDRGSATRGTGRASWHLVEPEGRTGGPWNTIR